MYVWNIAKSDSHSLEVKNLVYELKYRLEGVPDDCVALFHFLIIEELCKESAFKM